MVPFQGKLRDFSRNTAVILPGRVAQIAAFERIF